MSRARHPPRTALARESYPPTSSIKRVNLRVEHLARATLRGTLGVPRDN